MQTAQERKMVTIIARRHGADWRYLGVCFFSSLSSAAFGSSRMICRSSMGPRFTHKSALFVLRRLRNGLGTNDDAPKLSGTVEVDETYVGGKPRYRNLPTTGTGRGTRNKIPWSAWCSVMVKCGFVRWSG